jgi:hypothetical protein
MTNKFSMAYAISKGYFDPTFPANMLDTQYPFGGRLTERMQALSEAQMDVYWDARQRHGVRASLEIAERSIL